MPDQAGPAGRPGRAAGADGPIEAGTPADDVRARPLRAALDPGLRAEIDAIVAGASHDPHAVLGAHPGPDGVTVRALRPLAETVTIVLPDGRRFPASHLHEGVFAATLPVTEVPDYRIAVTYPGSSRPRRRRSRDRRSLPLPAHPGGDGPAPDRRGPARAAVAGARRARADASGTATGTVVRGVGAERARGAGHRRLQPLGRARLPDALARRRRACGSCSCPGSADGTRYKFEIRGPDGLLAAQGRPDGQPGRAAARDGVGGVHLPVPVGRRGLAGPAGQG